MLAFTVDDVSPEHAHLFSRPGEENIDHILFNRMKSLLRIFHVKHVGS